MLAPANLYLWPARLILRNVVALSLLLFVIASVALWHESQYWNAPGLRLAAGHTKHPIRKLMMDARRRHDDALGRRSTDLDTAAARYRARRKRHPPPGFDRWFKAAMDDKAVVVEDFFDRIYKDLTPYWALDPETLKKRAGAWHYVVRVRNGKASARGEVKDLVPWLQLWTELVNEFAEYLPDVDMPVNHMDEPRIILPFENVTELVRREAKERRMPRAEDVVSSYRGMGKVDAVENKPYDPHWHGPDENYWNLAVKGCDPSSPAHGLRQLDDLTGPVDAEAGSNPTYTYQGFVQNWTAAIDPCLQPHIRYLHGTFIEPFSISSTEELIPLFSGSKLPLNNEILIPGAMYLSKSKRFSTGASHGPSWSRKKNGLIWRGVASGGRAKKDTWHRFQRQRLVDMLNGTVVSLLETGDAPQPMAFKLQDGRRGKKKKKKMGAWLKTFSDAAFIHLCPNHECDFLLERFTVKKKMKMREQFRNKFLIDVDGNSFSARFRTFLQSSSLPLKATVYSEWHDDRLVPWLHFVPLDNTFRDLYPVLDFFADGDGGEGDMAARFIAESGMRWAGEVLRREDMRLYVWRLLLEWARVCDEERHLLGFVGDLGPDTRRLRS
ncbi:hypothetical protein CP532_4658 [Ophiocordyceps camponoti-leonardi (nom. inval.)]|nr:hypothetical protein CP532_4658 [Ophiocordyceps camponoti-leonardi (nom. inval.)]